MPFITVTRDNDGRKIAINTRHIICYLEVNQKVNICLTPDGTEEEEINYVTVSEPFHKIGQMIQQAEDQGTRQTKHAHERQG